MVPAAGLEPARDESPRILSPLCLPFHHAGVFGIATLCIRLTSLSTFLLYKIKTKLYKMVDVNDSQARRKGSCSRR